MNTTIHVAGGVGRAPTALSAYDSALAAANLHNYNLVQVSSIVPANATVKRVDRAPDLGPAGNKLTVVQAHAVADPGASEAVVAGLGWTTGSGPGMFYEATGTDPDAVRADLRSGLEAGGELREWPIEDRSIELATAQPAADEYVAAVVTAAYGDSQPVF
ncbi:MAG: pyruvoyl-dependent arginine decarboxylase [Halobacteriota archaeon]